MIFDILKTESPLPIDYAQDSLVHSAPDIAKMEAREIEKAYARLFASDDGQKVLAHLQVVTFQRALGPEAADQQLRYMEGQRSMVATILRMIDRGKRG
tara:strand:+ start:355 stop:648 length:294 start_codon:yes stop_codon:yes gene_type:complete